MVENLARRHLALHVSRFTHHVLLFTFSARPGTGAAADHSRMELIRKYKWWLFALIAVGGTLTWIERAWVWRENSQDVPILAAARKHGVDPALVKAVVWRESRFNPNARGAKGEVGLMQIMKGTAEDWAKAERIPLFMHAQLFDPAKNTQAGAWYLRKVALRYPKTDNPVPYALADYNAGRTKVLRWMKGPAATNSAAFIAQIDYPTTRQYVREVSRRYAKYRRVFPPKNQRQGS
jgi:soluble lytic murein transglycosylase